ncbi:hypothetical protein FB45DRAFT_901314 [Roridomyces roridus]|uniref:Tat pathway signal sequence n=1 Tax=Roridomyces roridus TaxID=1738132 RepID=A0AAD7CAH8_9AGAR|nr:hypothetical protein FB45DRAFT_901314 [Roridomyces roridus]
MSKEQEYLPLIAEDADVDTLPLTGHGPSARGRRKLTRWLIPALVASLIIETVTLVVLAAILGRKSTHPSCTVPGDQKVLYSPALGAVENQVQVYQLGFPGDMSPYQIPSSPKLDEMWSDLYNYGISRISKEEASLLPNKTSPIPGDPGYYIAELDVFHNLHCLNKVRMALDPDYYPDWRISTSNNHIATQKNATDHISHCVDWIRQSIMCHADTSVIVWQWAASLNETIVKGNVAHTCRKFDKITDWAKERLLVNAYDPFVHMEDDIVVPILHQEMP